MAVNPELLKILVCPLCKTPVSLTESGLGLKCSQCRRVYPIRDDIPVMLISEAKVGDLRILSAAFTQCQNPLHTTPFDGGLPAFDRTRTRAKARIPRVSGCRACRSSIC